jgi:mRNA interferase MazF
MQFGDVYAVDLPAVGGHEQAGQRPAIVVQSGQPPYSSLATVVVVPFTSQLKAQVFAGTILIEPDRSNGLRVASVALVFQIRVIDQRRIGRKIGELTAGHRSLLREELRRLLTLDESNP